MVADHRTREQLVMNETVKLELLAVENNSIDENLFHSKILLYLPNDRHYFRDSPCDYLGWFPSG